MSLMDTLMALVLVAYACVKADLERPRIYHPRLVKRQFSNSTMVAESLTPGNAPSYWPESLTEILATVSHSRPEISPGLIEDKESKVTTLVVQSTKIIISNPPLTGKMEFSSTSSNELSSPTMQTTRVNQNSTLRPELSPSEPGSSLYAGFSMVYSITVIPSSSSSNPEENKVTNSKTRSIEPTTGSTSGSIDSVELPLQVNTPISSLLLGSSRIDSTVPLVELSTTSTSTKELHTTASSIRLSSLLTSLVTTTSMITSSTQLMSNLALQTRSPELHILTSSKSTISTSVLISSNPSPDLLDAGYWSTQSRSAILPGFPVPNGLLHEIVTVNNARPGETSQLTRSLTIPELTDTSTLKKPTAAGESSPDPMMTSTLAFVMAMKSPSGSIGLTGATRATSVIPTTREDYMVMIQSTKVVSNIENSLPSTIAMEPTTLPFSFSAQASATGPTGTGKNNDAVDSNDKGDKAPNQKATTAGITMGVIGLSFMCGAAMFILASRYRRKRQTYQRFSTATSSQSSLEIRCAGINDSELLGGIPP